MAMWQGDRPQAIALSSESVALFRQGEDRWGLALTLTRMGAYGQVEALLEESLALWQELGDTWGTAHALVEAGHMALEHGDYKRAATLYEQSLSRYQAVDDKRGIAFVQRKLGEAAWYQGDAARAEVCCKESLALCQELGHKQDTAWSLHRLGQVAVYRGDYSTAVALHKESLALFRELGPTPDIPWGMEGLAAVVGAQGQPLQAARLFGAAAALREVSGGPRRRLDLADYDRDVAAVRAQLDEKSFAAAWAEGQAMPLEQAIAEALATTTEPAVRCISSQKGIACHSGVMTPLGKIVLMRMPSPRWAYSSATDLANIRTAALLAQYALAPGLALRPEADAMVMITPPVPCRMMRIA
jgi:tetratricopeptide (TPR) repeat protein